MPLTVDLPAMPGIGGGFMLLVTKETDDDHKARLVSPVGIFHCAGSRTEEGARMLQNPYLAVTHGRFGGCVGMSMYRLQAAGCIAPDAVFPSHDTATFNNAVCEDARA